MKAAVPSITSLQQARQALQSVRNWQAGWRDAAPELLKGRIRPALGTLTAALWRLAILLAAGVSLLLEAIIAIVTPVVSLADAILGWVLWPATGLIELLLSMPYVGRGLAWLWRIALSVAWALIHIVEFPLVLLGVMPPRRLRIWVMPCGEEDLDMREWWRAIDVAGRILRREANIQLIPVRPLADLESLSNKAETAGPIEWIHPLEEFTSKMELNVGCNKLAVKEDLGWVGGQLDRLGLLGHPRGSYRRLTGWGAPILVLAVDSVAAGALAGCSLGPLTDYITIRRDRPVCLAHELGHACNLPHSADANNLMNPTCGGVHLKRWQVLLLRLSRHASYF